jgi:excisionase family DNA binding protein
MPFSHRRASYSVPEAAQLLSISKSSLWRAVSAGRCPSTRIGGRTLVSAATVDAIASEGLAL